MVNYKNITLDRTFAALADPTRRALLARLGQHEEMSISALAQPFAMSLPAVMKHLDVLTDAGLIRREKTGRTVACRAVPEALRGAEHWIAERKAMVERNLDRLGEFLTDQSLDEKRVKKKPRRNR